MVSSNPGRAEAIVTHAERSISEDEIVAAARERAEELGAGAVTRRYSEEAQPVRPFHVSSRNPLAVRPVRFTVAPCGMTTITVNPNPAPERRFSAAVVVAVPSVAGGGGGGDGAVGVWLVTRRNSEAAQPLYPA